ncbi:MULTISPECIES: hypothetical protein [unclassified Imperialibacter]|uniref:hypothetical protein n=1 Tax=unclassified Imperialibacter TaxID=2629706 RepID=UPI00125EB57A|nr:MULTISPECIES: hypothetical protein [unclassified Imperialibacter]
MTYGTVEDSSVSLRNGCDTGFDRLEGYSRITVAVGMTTILVMDRLAVFRMRGCRDTTVSIRSLIITQRSHFAAERRNPVRAVRDYGN